MSSVAARGGLRLHEAVLTNEPRAVRAALAARADVDCRNNYGRAPIHWAASRGNVEIINMLIEAKCDIEAADKFGVRPLLMAASHGHLAAVQTLVQAGACLAATNKKQSSLLQCASARGACDVAAYALALGADVRAQDAAGDAALAAAAAAGADRVVDLLLDSGAEVDAVNKLGRSALHLACASGHPSTAALLVARGADKEARDVSGRSPLHLAVGHRHTELVRDLLESGCDVNAVDNGGVTALQMACAQSCRGIVEHLLAFEADVHVQNHVGSTALHAACAADATDIVGLLLARGADPAVTDQWSQCPLSVAGGAGGAGDSPPEGYRRAARGSFSAILDLLTATAKMDRSDNSGSTSPRNEDQNPQGTCPVPEAYSKNFRTRPPVLVRGVLGGAVMLGRRAAGAPGAAGLRWGLAVGTATYSLCLLKKATCKEKNHKGGNKNFPQHFLFGAATAAYHVEGGWDQDGKSESIWDHWMRRAPGTAEFGSGYVASNSYHEFKRDVEIVKELNLDVYKFSISWTRILPKGLSYKVNQAGIDYYNQLINELVSNKITPMVTMYHWDLPQVLQKLGGFANQNIVEWFADYAAVLFDNFSDRVKFWITFDSPKTICVDGYGLDKAAPMVNMSGIAEYMCVKNLLLAHAAAYRLFAEQYRARRDGRVGLALGCAWHEPSSDTVSDHQAAADARAFEWGLFAHPIFSKTGDFPDEVKRGVLLKSVDQGFPRSRLPELTASQVDFIRGTADFFGVNLRSTLLVYRDPSVEGLYRSPSYRDDAGVIYSHDPSWTKSVTQRLYDVPWGVLKLLTSIRKTYNNPPVFITGAGFSTETGLVDQARVRFLRGTLSSVLDAMADGSDVRCFNVWSLIDGFEWFAGYNERFGLYEVDIMYDEKIRSPRRSAVVYREIARTRTLDVTQELWVPLQVDVQRHGYSSSPTPQRKETTAKIKANLTGPGVM